MNLPSFDTHILYSHMYVENSYTEIIKGVTVRKYIEGSNLNRMSLERSSVLTIPIVGV